MADNGDENRGYSATAVFVFLIIGLPVLLFVPLLLSGIEHFTLGTSYVEEFCRDIGIHGFLGRIYEPVFEFFDRLVR